MRKWIAQTAKDLSVTTEHVITLTDDIETVIIQPGVDVYCLFSQTNSADQITVNDFIIYPAQCQNGSLEINIGTYDKSWKFLHIKAVTPTASKVCRVILGA